jgi:hypothetical protein
MKKFVYFLLPFLLVGCANTPIGETISNAIAPETIDDKPVTKNPNLPADFPLPVYQNSKLVESANTDREGRLVFTVNNTAEALKFYGSLLMEREWQNLSQTDRQIISFNRQYLTVISVTNTELTINYVQLQGTIDNPQTKPLPPEVTEPTTPQKPAELSNFIVDLQRLEIIPKNFNPDSTIPRREYARWLVTANNRLFQDRPAQQIRPALPAREAPIFKDVPQSDPDFGFIQGLANAGIIDRNVKEFQPDRPLTREVMVQWKAPLDYRKPIPPASSNAVQAAWNFQDSNKISPAALGAVLQDSRSGELSNIRRSFGFTTLFQPQKHVSRSEAATALWYFGDGETGISAKEILVAP